MNFKQLAIGAALGASMMSGVAAAGATGNVGVFSEYVFRGVEQSSGTAVQGGLDYSTSSGFYAGTWFSNTNFASGNNTATNELDIYTGFATKVGDVGVDVGALYYYYRDATELNTIELYAGATFGPLGLKVFFTDDYFGTDEDGLYAILSGSFPLSDSLSLGGSIGSSTGDGVTAFIGDEYTDYAVTLAKSLDGGMTFSLGITGTDLTGDDEKIVIGLKKGFDL